MYDGNDFCLEETDLHGNSNISAGSPVRTTEEHCEKIVLQTREETKKILQYSLILDVSTDLSGTSKHLVFIGGVKLNFQIT